MNIKPTIILEDIGNKQYYHELKHMYFRSHDIHLERYPLPVGDYILMNDKVSDVIARKSKRGISVKKMDFLGTYNIAVDTKKDMQEITGNICGKQHERFRDECILAKNNGIKLYVLIENIEGISCIDDVSEKWVNPRLQIMEADKSKIIGYWTSGKPKYAHKQKYPNATKGAILAKAMYTMQNKYGVEFAFCSPQQAGEEIIKLLKKGANNEGR